MKISRICAFGYYDRESPRFLSVAETYRKEGATVVECHTGKSGFFAKIRDLADQYRKLQNDCDAVFVMFPGHYLMPLAWLLTRRPGKTLLFDAILSLKHTKVDDRKLVSRFSPHALFLWCVDFVSCHLADQVIVDTEAHGRFFSETYHIAPSRIRVIYLGTRPDLFYPISRPERRAGEPLHVLFYGNYIPLQGVEYILQAAALLQKEEANARFTLIGGGQTYSAMRKLAAELQLENVEFVPFLPLKELAAHVQSADVCLGIFGKTEKAQRVIPHKVVDALACNIPIITEESPAIQERYAENPLVHTCPAGNPAAIAAAIRTFLPS